MTLEARAFIDVPFTAARTGFLQAGKAAGIGVDDASDALLLTLARGTIRLTGSGERTSVVLSAREPVGLQLLRDLIAERTEDVGLALDWQDKTAGGQPANLSLAWIAAVEPLTPSYARVVLEGPDLARFAEGGLHFRLLFGPAGADWPHTDEGGVTRWPGGAAAWHRPVYTTRMIEVLETGGAARIHLDVFLHDGGRVTEWTRTARTGDTIAITGPGGSTVPTAGWVCLIGDETALPVIARVLSDLPETTRGQATIIVPDHGDIQELSHPPALSLTWVLRDEGTSPLDILHAMTPPDSDRHVFFAAERSEAVAARAYLATQGLTRGEFTAAAYWTREDAE